MRPIWVHAVSVGEVAAAAPLIRAIRTRHEGAHILITTTTPTGSDTVRRQFGNSVAHVYFPYDFPSVIRRFLSFFNPKILILMETELWPNLLAACEKRKLPVFMTNGRLSERSVKRYRLFSAMTREMLASISCIAAQTDADAMRFITLGADSDAVSVTGSLKFDTQLPPGVYEQAEAIRRKLGANRRIFMAGSTRDGEEDILVDAFNRIFTRYPDVLMVIAPRHPERFRPVAELLRRGNLRVVERSSGSLPDDDTEVYLVDSMGELPLFYAASDVAFVGGSFVPVGGHNVLEPAGLGVPVIVGPHTFNITAICKLLEEEGALCHVSDADQLASTVCRWFGDSNSRDAAGAAGRRTVEQNRGASDRVMELLKCHL